MPLILWSPWSVVRQSQGFFIDRNDFARDGLQPHALTLPGGIASADAVRGMKAMEIARPDLPHAPFPGEAGQTAWKLSIG